MKKQEIVYTNKNVLGYFRDGKYCTFTTEETQNLLSNLKNEMQTKDKYRALASIIIGSILSFAFIILIILNLVSIIKIDWFTITIIFAAFILAWVLLYDLFGLIFFKKIEYIWHFKSNKTNANPNHCINYAGTDYAKFIEQYKKYLGTTQFIYKNTNISFCLYQPKTFKSPVYKGKLITNIPYYYFSFDGNKIYFLPGFIIFNIKNNYQIVTHNDFKYTLEDSIYTLYVKDEKIISFKDNAHFNVNFFNFKY